MMPSPRPRNTRQARAALEFALGRVDRANPVVVAWRWRYELLAATVLAGIWIALSVASATAVTIGLGVAFAAAAALPGGRRFLAARAWCIVTPHRVRVGCAQAWIHSRSGKIPGVLLTRRQAFGERVYLWCRAGTSVEDLSTARGLLAAACWADDVRVARHQRYAHLVTVDVVRRVPECGPVNRDGNGIGGTGTFADVVAGDAPYYVPGLTSDQMTLPPDRSG